MLERSWHTLEPDPPEYLLPVDLRARDVFGGRDCGWVSQMRPFVRGYSRPGDAVFDPFCGFGTTLLAAALEGREGLGMEIDRDRADLARERLQRHGIESPAARIVGGSLPHTTIPGRIDLCLTSVPYFGCRWPGDAASGQLYAASNFDAYLAGMRAVFYVIRDALPDDGYCIAMAENVRFGGRTWPVAWEIARILDSLFLACDERILCYPARANVAERESAPEQTPDAAMRNDRSHEYALIYRKQPPQIDIERTRALLATLRAEGFLLDVHGSFRPWIETDASDSLRLPADLDLRVPDDAGHWTRLLRRLRELGFRLTLWGDPVNADVSLDSLRRHAYLRAESIAGDGAVVRIDLALIEHAG